MATGAWGDGVGTFRGGSASRGVVPVTALVGIAASVIIDGTNGIIIRPGEPATIVTAIEWLVQDPVRLEAIREAGYETAKRFTWRATAMNTLELYRTARAARTQQ